MHALQALLAQDVVTYTDGGGKVKAAPNPIYGAEKVLRFFGGLLERFGLNSSRLLYEGPIDGLPAIVTVEAGGVLQTTAFAFEEERIVAIYVTRNPDKLKGIRGLVGEDVT